MKMVGWLIAGIGAIAATCLFAHQVSLYAGGGIWNAVTSPAQQLSIDQIILAYGILPRAAVALLAGAALGLSGALLQQLLRNPVADPSTLGISAGAQVAIVSATLLYPELVDEHRSAVALAGASLAALLVFGLGWRRAFEPVTMVVSGMLVGVTAVSFSSALTLGRGEYLMSLATWNGGSLSQQDWSVFRALGGEFIICMALALLLVRPLAVLSVGDSSAASLGLPLAWVRFAVASLATVLAAVVAAAVGLVSFIGLAAPAIVRACGARKPMTMIGLSPVAGALLLWTCDGVVQFVAARSSETFPTGAVTALVGGPLLLWLLPRLRKVDMHDEQPAAAARTASAKGIVAIILLLAVALATGFGLGRNGGGWFILSGQEVSDLFSIRWPRLLAAGAAGGLLALAGAVLQRLTANPIASPEVLGASGGAGLGYAAALTLVPAALPTGLILGATTGALVAMAGVLFFASRRDLPSEKLLLAGISISALSSAVLSALVSIGDQRSWQILAWLGGSTSQVTSGQAIILAFIAAALLTVSFVFTRWLAVLPLGLAPSVSLGLPVRGSRVLMLLACGVATGAASLLVGPLSFVGLIAPHIALRAGFTAPAQHLTAAFLTGLVLMIFADFGARSVTFPYDLPLGLFAALLGGPYLIWLVTRR